MRHVRPQKGQNKIKSYWMIFLYEESVKATLMKTESKGVVTRGSGRGPVWNRRNVPGYKLAAWRVSNPGELMHSTVNGDDTAVLG